MHCLEDLHKLSTSSISSIDSNYIEGYVQMDWCLLQVLAVLLVGYIQVDSTVCYRSDNCSVSFVTGLKITVCRLLKV